MKKIFFFFLLGISIVVGTSCRSGKTGCPAEDATVKTNKKGELPTKAGKSNLFPKSMRKKMGM